MNRNQINKELRELQKQSDAVSSSINTICQHLGRAQELQAKIAIKQYRLLALKKGLVVGVKVRFTYDEDKVIHTVSKKIGAKGIWLNNKFGGTYADFDDLKYLKLVESYDKQTKNSEVRKGN